MINPIPDTPYICDILQQPAALKETLAEMGRLDLGRVAHYGRQIRSGKLDRLILTGMGSSYHGLYPLLLSLLRQGVQVQMVEASELIHQIPGLIASSGLMVAVSQSGASAEVQELTKLLSPNTGLIGVTNTAESPLARCADVALITQAGSENTVSCKTYISGLAAQVVLGGVLLGRTPAAVISDLVDLPDLVAQYLSGMQEFTQELQEKLTGIEYLVLAGRGSSLAAALTGGLIIKEAAHFPAEGMSCAAFRHGPLDMASPRLFVLVYEGLDPTRGLNRNLVTDIRKFSGQAALVECASGKAVFHIPVVADPGLPILEILPAQMLSVALACLHDREPGKFSWGSKVTSIE